MKNLFNMKKFLINLFSYIITLTLFFNFFQTINSNQAFAEGSHTIPIAYALDDNYIYPTLVSITSLMVNSNENTHYDLYIMVPGNFKNINKTKLLKLENKFKNKCTINIINMEDHYKNANTWSRNNRVTTPTYYRLSLSSLLPNVNKIIWLDGDTLIFKDLTSMLDIDMNNFYYKGFLDCFVNGLKHLGIDDDHYICAGVMLINLEKLRQDKMEEKFINFIEKNNSKLIQNDQTLINAVCYKNIGVLPARYGTFIPGIYAKKYVSRLRAENKYTVNEVEEAWNHPVILHCAWKTKVWKRKKKDTIANLWWKYAEKTGYINEIKEKYNYK